MGKRAPEPEPHVNHERWLISYADFITLLMIFFLVLYSMSSVNAAKFQALTQTLNQSMGGASKAILNTGSEGILKDQMPSMRAQQLTPEDAYNKAVKSLEKQIKQKKVTVTKDSRGAVIRLNSDFFFPSGEAELNTEAKKLCAEITKMFDTVGNNIQIEGHTDNLPISSDAGFSSNWELGAQRAINVVKALDEYGIHHGRLSAASYADTRPMNSSGTEEGNAKNRRVEIIILSQPEKAPEPEIRLSPAPEEPAQKPETHEAEAAEEHISAEPIDAAAEPEMPETEQPAHH